MRKRPGNIRYYVIYERPLSLCFLICVLDAPKLLCVRIPLHVVFFPPFSPIFMSTYVQMMLISSYATYITNLSALKNEIWAGKTKKKVGCGRVRTFNLPIRSRRHYPYTMGWKEFCLEFNEAHWTLKTRNIPKLRSLPLSSALWIMSPCPGTSREEERGTRNSSWHTY